MKSGYLLFVAMVSVFEATSLTALAGSDGGGTHVGGGGKTIDINQRPSLKDLVDRTVCIAKSGREVRNDNPYYEKIIEAIHPVHQYFAEALSVETDKLTYCFTEADLLQISDRDKEGVTIYENKNSRQVAIRFDEMVYIDSKIFSQMSASHRSYLILHETMHSFISMETERRNLKLRSIVAAIRRHQVSPMTPAQFRLQLRTFSISYSAPRVPLISAIYSGDVEGVSAELNKGADPNASTYKPEICIKKNDCGGFKHNEIVPALVLAAQLNYPEILQVLLSQEWIDVDQRTSVSELSAIQLAALKGHREAFQILFANPFTNKDGALVMAAALGGNVDTLAAALREPGLEFPGLWGGAALLIILDNCRLDLLQLLVNQTGFSSDIRLAELSPRWGYVAFIDYSPQSWIELQLWHIAQYGKAPNECSLETLQAMLKLVTEGGQK